ncbi:MAG: HAD-IA family hydrolase [Clostridia bacterium]|nr:HAD-IA family hydrolase [Clostridia bacterium]
MKFFKDILKKVVVGRRCLSRDKKLNYFFTLLNKCDIVSFDMFDTLICRNVSQPIDIFRIEEEWINNEYKIESNFAQKRHDAEIKLYKEVGQKAVLKDIYEKLNNVYNKSMCDLFMKKELELEKKFIQIKNEGKKLFDICKKSGKKIIITTDMYLPANFLTDILQSLGYSFDEIFVSGEIGLSKGNGMFEFLKKKFKDKQILHIGDNIKIDFSSPKKQGVLAYNVAKTNYDVSDNINVSIANALIKNKNFDNELEKFGYCYFGPFLYDFCIWLHKMKEEKKIDLPLLFLSRGGYMAYKVYKKMFPKDKVEYIRISRRLIIWLKLDRDCSILNMYNVLNNINRKFTINNIIDIFQLKNIDIVNLNLDLKKEYKISDFENDANLKSFYNLIYPIIKQKTEEKCKLIEKYLFPYLNNYNNIGIVDEGWRGIIQDNLKKYYKDKNFYGFYIGSTTNDNDKYGFLIKAKTNLRDYIKIFFSMDFIEEINAENESSLIDLEWNDKIELIFANQANEEKNSKSIFEVIQIMANNFIDDFILNLDFLPKETINFKNNFLKFLDNPSKNFIFEILNSYTDNAGIIGKMVNHIKSKNFFKKIKISKDSTWKMASLKINFCSFWYFWIKNILKLKIIISNIFTKK